jgi:hypothetical protein
MRKVVVQQFVTLDGYAAGPNGELDFVTEAGAAADPTSGPVRRGPARSLAKPVELSSLAANVRVTPRARRADLVEGTSPGR